MTGYLEFSLMHFNTFAITAKNIPQKATPKNVIVNKQIIFEFGYEKTPENALKIENFRIFRFFVVFFCTNIMVLGDKIAEIFEKKTRKTQLEKTRKKPVEYVKLKN